MIFFFQAEDGIRDYKVTGVQTCALPIFHIGSRAYRLALARTRPLRYARRREPPSSATGPVRAALAGVRRLPDRACRRPHARRDRRPSRVRPPPARRRGPLRAVPGSAPAARAISPLVRDP